MTSTDATVTGSSVTSSGGTTTICANYLTKAAVILDRLVQIQAPSLGMVVYDQDSGAFLGTVAGVGSAHAFTLNREPGNMTGAMLLLSAYGGCAPADYYGGRPGTSSGQPRAAYWDNCLWGSRNVTVRNNVFAINASTVRGCRAAKNMCGFMENAAFNAGQPEALHAVLGFLPAYIAKASGGLGNVWSQNTYTWSGPGAWQFWAGTQENEVSQKQWQAAPYEQDADSTFG